MKIYTIYKKDSFDLLLYATSISDAKELLIKTISDESSEVKADTEIKITEEPVDQLIAATLMYAGAALDFIEKYNLRDIYVDVSTEEEIKKWKVLIN
jgi:hypothetical protein